MKMYGKRFQADDHIGEFISNRLRVYIASFHLTLDLFSLVRYLPKFKKIVQDTISLSVEWKRFFDNKIDECLNSPSEEANFGKEFVKMSN